MGERDHSDRPVQPDTADDRLVERRDPIEHSDSGCFPGTTSRGTAAPN